MQLPSGKTVILFLIWYLGATCTTAEQNRYFYNQRLHSLPSPPCILTEELLNVLHRHSSQFRWVQETGTEKCSIVGKKKTQRHTHLCHISVNIDLQT